MAFMDFHEAPATGFSVQQDTRFMPEALFSGLERSVLSLARQDRASSLRVPGRLDRIVKALFGLQPPNPLADPRLEALRRLVVAARRRGARAVARERQRFLVSGYSALQAATVLQLARA